MDLFTKDSLKCDIRFANRVVTKNPLFATKALINISQQIVDLITEDSLKCDIRLTNYLEN